MSIQLKQRLIGAIVMVAFAVIFIPIFFSQDKQAYYLAKQQVQIPAPPSAPDVQQLMLNLGTPVDMEATVAAVPMVEGQVAAEAPLETIVPPIPQQAAVKLQQTNTVTKSAVAVAKPVKAKQAAVKSAKSHSRIATTKKPKAWVIQLGSFHHEKNALALQVKLRAQGFPAYVRIHKQLSRVLVGPELRRETADKLLVDLHNKFKLNGIVMPYAPSKA